MTIMRAIEILHPDIPVKINSLAEREIAHKMAVEALEKQIPKNPILKAMDGFDFDVTAHVCCPQCENPIVNVWSKAEYRPKFCHYCGQALKWSEKDE